MKNQQPVICPDIWEQLRYFSKREAWGNPDLMDARLLTMLDNLRHRLGKPIIIHAGYAVSGHAPNSYHYRGMAADFHVETEEPFIQLAGKIITWWWFGGVGVYHHWNNPGFHLDIRPSPLAWNGNEDGSYDVIRPNVPKHTGLNEAFAMLEKQGVI